jgi:hypothetical protein
MMNDYAFMSDEDLFNPQRVYYSQEEFNSAKAERDRRTNQKRMEQERAEQERAAKLKRHQERRPIQRGSGPRDLRAHQFRRATDCCLPGRSHADNEALQSVVEGEPSLEFNAVFNMSIHDRLFVFEEQVVEIADDMQHDFKTVIKNGKEKRVADPDMAPGPSCASRCVSVTSRPGSPVGRRINPHNEVR